MKELSGLTKNNPGAPPKGASLVGDHLSNERTFLSWIRTSMGIMAFGFVVVKFTLFMKQIALVLGNRNLKVNHSGYSSFIGITLVGVGTLTALFAYFRYRQVDRQIRNSNYTSSPILVTAITSIILLISLSLVVYLIQKI
ncbi:MAG: YidH family protein [Chitinophagaceae bacterium]